MYLTLITSLIPNEYYCLQVGRRFLIPYVRWFRSLLTAIFFVFSCSRRRLRIWVQRASSTLKTTLFRFLHLVNDNWFIFTCLAVFAPEGFLIPYLNSSSRENRLGKSSWISPDDDLMLNKLCFDNARFCHEVFASSYWLVAKISFYHIPTHLSKGTCDRKQNCTQLPTPLFLHSFSCSFTW